MNTPYTQVVDMFNLHDLPQPEQEEKVARITELAIQGLMIDALDDMNEADKVILENMTETGAQMEDMISYVQETLPDFDQRLAEQLTVIQPMITNQ